MTDSSVSRDPRRSSRDVFRALELDTRLLGMIGAVVLIFIVFDVLTHGLFLTPRNIFNLTIQTVSVAIMATGMVFVIVTRNIDLSVGSLLGTVSAVMAMVQTVVLPDWLGMGLGNPFIWIIVIICGLAIGTLIGAFQGYLVGYLMIPSFIVTLGGLLVWRNVAWYLTNGQTIGPLDANFVLFGGIEGTLGVAWSWAIAALAVLAAWAGLWQVRRNKLKHGFMVKPAWAEVAMGGIVAVAILGFVEILNAYQIPILRLKRMFKAAGKVLPDGYTVGYGIPISVLLLIVVAIVMTIVARRARLDRGDLEALAAANALVSLTGHRHRARWACAGIEPARPLLEDNAVAEAIPLLKAPGEGEQLVADYASTGLSLGRHPLALLRPRLTRLGLQQARHLRACLHGSIARTGGIVTGRQSPGSASGVMFITLEDETGITQVIVWPQLAQRQRRLLLGARLLAVEGEVQREGEVLHLIARRLEDHSHLLGRLITQSRDFH